MSDLFKRVNIQVITATDAGDLIYDSFWLIDTGLTMEEIKEHIIVSRLRSSHMGKRCFIWEGIVFPINE